MGYLGETGPAIGLSRGEVYARAQEIAALARIAMDCASTGPRMDVPRAVKVLARIQQISASDMQGGDDGER